MAAEPKKKTSKVRSKTRRAHRHDSIRDENLWQSGMLPKKERREQFAQYRRRKNLSTAPVAEKPKPEPKKADKPAAPAKKAAPKKTTTKKATPPKKKE